MTSDKNAKVSKIASLLLKAKQAYYFSGQEIMSDAEYDGLEEELAGLDPEHPVLKMVGAPVGEGAGHLSRASHRMMMGSQNKVNTAGDFGAWLGRRGGVGVAGGLHCSLKADGCSIAAYYEEGELKQVITRGDGVEGEDVTANAYCFKGLPTLLQGVGSCAVRLEAVLTVPDWLAIDPEQTSNPRSLANGILGRKDGKNANSLTALAFDVEGVSLDTEEEKSRWLEEMGFTTTQWSLSSSEAEVEEFLQKHQRERDGGRMLYWADGVVVKINSLAIQQRLGEASGRPKGQVAWKFSAEKATSRVIEVEWTVGHTGAVTPVAQVEAVRLGGTTVQRVSLANPEIIGALGLKIGSEVEIVKAGDIIPKITKVIKSGEGRDVLTPSCCPDCDSALQKMTNVDGSDSTVVYCRNSECESQSTGRIKRWAKSRDVLGLGDSVIEALCREGKIRTVADLFELKEDAMENIIINQEKGIRLGRKRADSICREIREKGSKMSLPEFLGSFGTRKLGVRRAQLMINANPELSSIDKWFDGSLLEEEFAARAGVPNAGRQIFEGLLERKDVIDQAKKHISIEESSNNAQPVSGRCICITGSLPSGRKKGDWKEPLEKAGFTLTDKVTKDLYALVVSDPSVPTSKSQKASKMGIKIISEDDLQKICANNPSPAPDQGIQGSPVSEKGSTEVAPLRPAEPRKRQKKSGRDNKGNLAP
jgi:DNA ligase (NAD+)